MHHPIGGTNPRRVTRSKAHHSSPFVAPKGRAQAFSMGRGCAIQAKPRLGRSGPLSRLARAYLFAFFSLSIALSGNNEFRFGAKCSKQAQWALPS
jgi:hypothetical protein